MILKDRKAALKLFEQAFGIECVEAALFLFGNKSALARNNKPTFGNVPSSLGEFAFYGHAALRL